MVQRSLLNPSDSYAILHYFMLVTGSLDGIQMASSPSGAGHWTLASCTRQGLYPRTTPEAHNLKFLILCTH